MTWIAEDRVIWVFPDGRRVDGRVAIGAPAPSRNPAVEGDTAWQCEAALDGMLHRPLKTFGEGSLQALLLLQKLVGYELHAFISRGGRLLMPEEGEGWHPILASFRELLRRPDDPLTADPVLAELDAELARPADEPDGDTPP